MVQQSLQSLLQAIDDACLTELDITQTEVKRVKSILSEAVSDLTSSFESISELVQREYKMAKSMVKSLCNEVVKRVRNTWQQHRSVAG